MVAEAPLFLMFISPTKRWASSSSRIQFPAMKSRAGHLLSEPEKDEPEDEMVEQWLQSHGLGSNDVHGMTQDRQPLDPRTDEVPNFRAGGKESRKGEQSKKRGKSRRLPIPPATDCPFLFDDQDSPSNHLYDLRTRGALIAVWRRMKQED